MVDSLYSVYANADKLKDVLGSKVVSTTDATVTTLLLIPIEDNTTYHIEATVLAVRSGSSDRASYTFAGTFYRAGGSAIQQGSTTALHTVESDASWAATFDVSGNDVRIRVTGAAMNIDWRGSAEYMRLSN